MRAPPLFVPGTPEWFMATSGINTLAPLYSPGALTLSAGVITDTVRAAGVEGDGGDIGDGVGVWPAATNIATQSIPGALATTGVTKAGDAAATLTKVADSTHPFPNATADVWCLDNSAGSTDATVDFDGNATAAAHTASIWAYKPAGSPTLSIEGTSPTAISGATWARYTNTKTATAGDNLRITAPSGAVVYFVAAQLETGSIATPFILTDGGTASRVAGTITIPASVLDETQMWVAGRLNLPWANPPVTDPGLWTFADSANERLEVNLVSASQRIGIVRGSGGSVASTSSLTSWSAGDDVSFAGAFLLGSVKVSTNGQVFTANTATQYIPTLSATVARLGDRNTVAANRLMHGAFRWVAFGKGTLADADAALFHSWGNNDPLPHMFPRSAQLTALLHFNGDGTLYRYAS